MEGEGSKTNYFDVVDQLEKVHKKQCQAQYGQSAFLLTMEI